MDTPQDNELVPQEYRDILHPSSVRAIESRLALMRPEDREEALQEAIVAFMAGKKPTAAVSAHERRERLYRQRFTPLSQLLPETNAED